jgi:hypothetical protein
MGCQMVFPINAMACCRFVLMFAVARIAGHTFKKIGSGPVVFIILTQMAD